MTLRILLPLFAVLCLYTGGTVEAKPMDSPQETLIKSCGDASKAFSLLSLGIDRQAAVIPSAEETLRQSAMLFFHCANSASTDRSRHIFSAYYAGALYLAGSIDNDQKSLTQSTAVIATLLSGSYRGGTLKVLARFPTLQSVALATPSPSPTPRVHSPQYCTVVAKISATMASMKALVALDTEAGNDDTQNLASTGHANGKQFRLVEDDASKAKDLVTSIAPAIVEIDKDRATLQDWESSSVQTTVRAMALTTNYLTTYMDVALQYERGIHGANTQLIRANINRAFANQQKNKTVTTSYGNANCSSYFNNASCNGYASSTTTTDNSAIIAQERATQFVAAAQSGRMSYNQMEESLAQGLSVLSAFDSGVDTAIQSWNAACP